MLSVLVPVPQLLETPGRNNGETSTYITGFKAHPNLFSDYKFSIPKYFVFYNQLFLYSDINGYY